MLLMFSRHIPSSVHFLLHYVWPAIHFVCLIPGCVPPRNGFSSVDPIRIQIGSIILLFIHASGMCQPWTAAPVTSCCCPLCAAAYAYEVAIFLPRIEPRPCLRCACRWIATASGTQVARPPTSLVINTASLCQLGSLKAEPLNYSLEQRALREALPSGAARLTWHIGSASYCSTLHLSALHCSTLNWYRLYASACAGFINFDANKFMDFLSAACLSRECHLTMAEVQRCRLPHGCCRSPLSSR